MLTTEEAAQQLRLKPVTVRRWLRAGRMRGTYFSDRAGWRIAASEVERIKQEGPDAAPPQASGDAND